MDTEHLNVKTTDGKIVKFPCDIIERYPNSPLFGILNSFESHQIESVPLDVDADDLKTIIKHLEKRTLVYDVDIRLKLIMDKFSLTDDRFHYIETMLYNHTFKRLHEQLRKFDMFAHQGGLLCCETDEEYRMLLTSKYIPIQVMVNIDGFPAILVCAYSEGIPIVLRNPYDKKLIATYNDT